MWVKNITNFGRFCCLNIPCLRINITLIVYEFFKPWINALEGKLKNRCFCWFPAAIFVPRKGTQTWRRHTKLRKFGSNGFSNISHLKYRTDLILGEAFCLFIFFYFLDSGLSVLNGLQFYFWLRDSENRELEYWLETFGTRLRLTLLSEGDWARGPNPGTDGQKDQRLLGRGCGYPIIILVSVT